MAHRSRTEICVAILEAANQSTTKTKIMYKAFLSNTLIDDYLEVLTENGLLKYDEQKHMYITTEKGQLFLSIYNNPEQVIIK